MDNRHALTLAGLFLLTSLPPALGQGYEALAHQHATEQKALLKGRILSHDKEQIDFATVYLKDTQYGAITDGEGHFRLEAPAGEYILVVSAMGFETVERPVKLSPSVWSWPNGSSRTSRCWWRLTSTPTFCTAI